MYSDIKIDVVSLDETYVWLCATFMFLE